MGFRKIAQLVQNKNRFSALLPLVNEGKRPNKFSSALRHVHLNNEPYSVSSLSKFMPFICVFFSACSGFLCDKKRCIPNDWRCDGHVDCLDQTDESKCDTCGPDSIYCGENKCMSSKHVCDGEINCPYGQDERNCSE